MTTMSREHTSRNLLHIDIDCIRDIYYLGYFDCLTTLIFFSYLADVQCSVLGVPEPPLIGRIEGSRMGHSAVFECPTGYRLEGASGITCQYNGKRKRYAKLCSLAQSMINERKCIFVGKWSADVPHCEEIECPPIDIPENALLQLIEHNNTYGGQAVFTCMWGHKLSGSQSIRCDSDGRWKGSLPTCLGI